MTQTTTHTELADQVELLLSAITEALQMLRCSGGTGAQARARAVAAVLEHAREKVRNER